MRPNRVHILGASGSGTTTLGKALAARLECPHYDTDDYFWLPTGPPFQEKRDAADRQHLLRGDLAHSDGWVLSGSLCGWGDVFIPQFTLVVFLWIPPSVRLERLRSRERLRYGDAVLPGGPMHEAHLRFLDWASGYDTGGMDMRSRQRHEAWLANLRYPVVRIAGDLALEDQVRFILHHIVEPSGDRLLSSGEPEEAKMSSCFLCSKDLAPVVAEGNYWRLVLNINQNFLGKCMWVLRRHIEPVPDLSTDEWAELHGPIGQTRNMLHAAFQPDHYNYAFMQNLDKHVHLHVVPRYAATRTFEGLKFSDPDWPGHYTALNPSRRLSPEAMTTLAEHLRLIWSQASA